jgi:hypothetical protein
MDSLLVMATLVSLLLGTIMALVAWRMLRQHAERRAARVEALQALADADPVDAVYSAPAVPRGLKTPGSVGMEAGSLDPAIVHPDLQYADEPAANTHFFDMPERLPESRWQARMAVALALAACAAVPYALYQMGVFSAIATAAPAGQALPLELLSLRHMVDDQGGFTVTGLVQNPGGGRKATGLVAVVYLFDDAGRFMATGRAAVDVPSLQAGEEASFTVTIPKMSGVSKYRVGFRLAEGGVIGHVDRRGQPPTETTEDGIGVGSGRSTASPAFLPRRSEG